MYTSIKVVLVIMLINTISCATFFPNRMEDCKNTCLKLADKNATIKFKTETDEHFCLCEGER